MDRDRYWMEQAMEQAREAARLGEVPVGAVICRGDRLVAAACNRRELDKNALAHAELLAIDAACKALGGWRLHECDLYVTLEPCPMCTGAIINARIRRVAYGARDPKAGCMGSLVSLTELPFNHRPEIAGDVCGEQCAEMLKSFFAGLRQKRKGRA